MRTKFCALVGVCAAIFGVSGGVDAQDAPQLSSVLTVEVKPGTNGQFEEFVRKFRDASEQSNSPQRWRTVSSVTGGEVYTFTQRFGSFTALAEPGPELDAVYGEAGAARLLGLLQASAIVPGRSLPCT